MKHKIAFFTTIFFWISLLGQTGNIQFSGRLASKDRIRYITLQNFDGIKITVPTKARNAFSFSDSLPKGFYEVDKIGTIYLSPGYNLSVHPRGGRSNPGRERSYTFAGTGALENNLLREAKWSSFIPLDESGDLQAGAYKIDPTDFLNRIDTLVYSGKRLFNQSTDSFFRKYALPDLDFFGKQLCQLYYMHIMGDPGVQSTVDSAKRLNNMFKAASKMSTLISRIYSDWDRNDGTLFCNSSWYRQAFQNFFIYKPLAPKYLFELMKGGQQASPYDMMIRQDLIKLQIVREEISDPYISSYFDYSFTRSLLEDIKDTAVLSKYYKEYLKRSSRPDYQASIKEIYDNAISYTNHTPAPSFSYKDRYDKRVSLESLSGKYIYIDVWATWCGPCKEEIPHLKEVEAVYQDKNIEFVSISLDELQNKKKWKEFVKANDLKGIQLISDSSFESAFIQKMGIHSIPRFILIDPSGRIIANDAMRPSDKKLLAILDKLLL